MGVVVLGRLLGRGLRLVLRGLLGGGFRHSLGGLVSRFLHRLKAGRHDDLGAQRVRVGDNRVDRAVAVRVRKQRRAILQEPAGKGIPLRRGGIGRTLDRVPSRASWVATGASSAMKQ